MVVILALTMVPGDGRPGQKSSTSAQAAEASAARGPYRSRPDLSPPPMQVKERAPEASHQKIFVGSKVRGATIYAASGEPIWFRPGRVINFRTQTYRGKPVLTWFQAPTKGSGLKRNTYVIANRNYKIIKKVYPGHGYEADSHEFRLTSRGTAYVTSFKSEKRNLSFVGMSSHGPVSDSIAQEIDLRTGKVVWEWHSLDHVPLRDTYAEKLRRPGVPFDYFHINSIIDTPDGNVLVSGRSTNAVYKVNRRTGHIMWTLGGRSSDFRMGKRARFSSQHDAELHSGNQLSLFDNGDSPVISKPVRKQSRGMVLKLNYRKMEASLVREFFNPAKPLASQQANVQKLPGGSYFVGWGGIPLISEYGADDKMVFDAEIEGISSFYRAFRARWSGRPMTRVDVFSRHDKSGDTRVFISWNGDSRVRQWKVLAGESRDSLVLAGKTSRTGFETATKLDGTPAYLKVVGLGPGNARLGASRIVKVGE